MDQPFQILGIEPCLVISDEALRDAFREAGRVAHPDVGGGEGDFARLREAFAVVSSPSSRLRAWLEWRGTPGEVRGSIEASLMEVFSEVGAVTQQAESLIRRREEAKSALVRAMLECALFPQWELSLTLDIESASKAARNLAFLEKWRTSLRSGYSRLI
jgi:curved DNA-binding protein CbpA